MQKESIGLMARWRMRIVASTILCLAPTMLMACALQNPLAETVQVMESHVTTVPMTAAMVASSPTEYAFFGGAVAVSGNTAVIGAWGEADPSRNSGAAYVFDLDGDTWTQRVRLTAPDAVAGARFGHAVAIDAGVILVGAIYDNGDGPRAGAVYVFELMGDAWTETSRLTPSDPSADAHFGSAIDLDGDTAVIGASGPNAVAAYVFQATDTGWTQQARLASGSPSHDTRFGISVALEGDTAVVGAPSVATSGFEDDSAEPTPGSAYVFERRDGVWTEHAVLTEARAGAAGAFGHAVAIGDGAVAVGAPGEVEAVFVYRRSEAAWELRSELLGPSGSTEHFGVSVSVDGGTLVVGAPGSADLAGAAYIFEDDGSDWIHATKVVATNPDPNLHLGGSVAVDGSIALVGATGGRGAGVASGAVFTVH